MKEISRKYYNSSELLPDGLRCVKYRVKDIMILTCCDFSTPDAVIFSHGGYTPARSFLQKGSGFTTVPAGLKIQFATPHDLPNQYYLAYSDLTLREDFDYPSYDVSGPGQQVVNYHLQYVSEQGYPSILPQKRFDIIKIAPNASKKVHLNDVFSIKKTIGSAWRTLHYFPCRTNKLSDNNYTFD